MLGPGLLCWWDGHCYLGVRVGPVIVIVKMNRMVGVTMTRCEENEELILAEKAKRGCRVCKHYGVVPATEMSYCDRGGKRVFKDTGCDDWAFFRTDGPEIIGVAVQQGDLVICLPRPKRHHDVMRYAVEVLGLTPPIGTPVDDQGFYLADGRYMTRKEALAHVKETGQELINPDAKHYLFSEDLW